MTVHINAEWAKRLECMIYHKDIPQDAVINMTELRQQYIQLAVAICQYVPESRSKSLCLTYLEESLMRCIQALALTGSPDSTVY